MKVSEYVERAEVRNLEPGLRAHVLLAQGEVLRQQEPGPVSRDLAMFFITAAMIVLHDLRSDLSGTEDRIGRGVLLKVGDFLWENRNNIEPDVPVGSSYVFCVSLAHSFWQSAIERGWDSDRYALASTYKAKIQEAYKEILAIWMKEYRPQG